MLVVAGGIGGTSARMAYLNVQGDRIDPVIQRTFQSDHFSGFTELVEEFSTSLEEHADAACFSVAGAVRGEHLLSPNLGWTFDYVAISQQFSIKNVHVMNDLEAKAYGIATLEQSDFAVLNQGLPGSMGNQAVVSAGTGLGEAGLHWNGKQHHAFATEGGHTDFAPRNRLEVDPRSPRGRPAARARRAPRPVPSQAMAAIAIAATPRLQGLSRRVTGEAGGGWAIVEGSPGGTGGPMDIVNLPIADVLTSLKTSERGLDEGGAGRRLREFGPNRIEEVRGKPLWLRFLGEFTHFFALILWVAAALAFFAEWRNPGEGMRALGVAILVVIAVNGAFSFWQEYRAERAIAALRRLLPQQAKAVRGGEERRAKALRHRRVWCPRRCRGA